MTARTHIKIGARGFCDWLGCPAGQDKAREVAQALGLDPSAVTCEYADPAQAERVAEALRPLFKEGSVTVHAGPCFDGDVRGFIPSYSRWRHGGWYVQNISRKGGTGGCGCVSNNYEDGKWRIVCGHDHAVTFKTRDAAARAEYRLSLEEREAMENAQA